MGVLSDFRQLLRTAAAGWWSHRAPSLGAAFSFFTVFSLAPMLLAAISIAGLAFGREATQGAVVGQLSGLLGENAAQALEAMLASAGDFGSGLIGTTVGLVTFLMLATGALVELQDDLNIIWGVRTSAAGIRSFLRTRVLSLAFVAGIGLLLLVSLMVDAGLSAGMDYVGSKAPNVVAILGLLNNAIGLVFAVALFAMVFKVLPAVRLDWSDVWLGALFTGVLFTLGKIVIGAYVGRSGIASSYGTAASVITLLLWIYYSSLILLFGAEFTKAYAQSTGSQAAHRRKGPS